MESTYSIDGMTEGQFKRRFRKLARVMHPDTNTGSNEQMKELGMCHENNCTAS
jgi:DnaJ-class molecular chaperone